MSAMKRWQFWLGLAISILFLYLALRGLHFKDVWNALSRANYWWLIPGIGVYFIGVWVRAWRWHYLLRPVKPISTPAMFPIVTIGYAGNNIFPARAGEVLRAVILKRRQGVSISASLATIIVERVYDGVVMLAFVFLNLPELARLTMDSGLGVDIQTLAIWGAVVFILALAVFLLAAMFPERAGKLVESMVRRILPQRYQDKVIGLAERFIGGLESLRSPREALMVFVTSTVIWLLETVKYWFLMHAFTFEVSFFTLMLMNGIANLVTTIPSAPGYIGTFDAAGVAVLVAYSIDRNIAFSYTIVLHAALLVPITILGLYYLAQEGIRWGTDIQQIRAET